MRAAGRRIDDQALARISPAHSENINFFGAIEVDIEGGRRRSAQPGTGRGARHLALTSELPPRAWTEE
jgi:hypothetical protein